jgi:hypothetical protein
MGSMECYVCMYVCVYVCYTRSLYCSRSCMYVLYMLAIIKSLEWREMSELYSSELLLSESAKEN